MEIKAIVFDLGGTLIEYAGTYAKWPDLETPGFMAAYNYLKEQGVSLPQFMKMRQVGFEMLPRRWQQATAGIKNLRLVDLIAEVLAACAVDGVSPAQLVAAAELYQTAVRSQASPLPAAQETLAQVKAQGYKIGLLSNTMFTGAAHREDLKRFGMIDYFDTMLFSADVNKWKPNAAPFLHLLHALGVKGETAVYIGDDPGSDIVGGQRAGMCTIHMNSSQRFHMPHNVQPHARIHSLTELLPTLARLTVDRPNRE